MAPGGGTFPSVALAPIGINLKDEDVSEDAFRAVGKELVKVFADVGFCFITDHGIDKSLLDKTLDNSKAFFTKPHDVKKSYMRKTTTVFTGWMPFPDTSDRALKSESFETELPDLKETYNLTKWTDESQFASDEVVPGFRSTALRYLEAIELLSKRVLLAFGYGLGLEEPRSLWKATEKIEAQIPDVNPSQVRFAHYPRVSAGQRQKGQFWCGEHSDFGLISFLSNNGVSGLQIMTKAGEYIDVPRCDDELLLNVGDCLERLTGGILRSVPHRVDIKEDEKEDRYSVNYFIIPDNDASLDPLCGAKDEYEEKMTTKDFFLLRIGGESLKIKKGICKAFQQQGV